MFEHALLVGKVAAALGSAMVGGTFFAFSAFLMRVLQQLPPSQGITVMQAINQVILASLFLPVFVASAVLSLGLAAAAPLAAPFAGGSTYSTFYVIAGAGLYLIGVFGVTIVFNVPRNNMLAQLLPLDPQSPALWNEYVKSWTRYNHVRTIAAAAATILFLL